MSVKKTISAKIIRHLREWHRTLGIWAAFFLIFLSITGIALNHTNFLSLAHQSITQSFLLNHYGIHSPNDVRFYADKKIIVTDQLVWMNEKLLFESDKKIVSIGQYLQYFVVVTNNELHLYNQHGQLIDQLNSLSGLPQNISALSNNSELLMVKASNGYYQADKDLLEWTLVATFVEPEWLIQETASDEEIIQANVQYRSQFLNWERIILDAHSGRIFGDFGVLFMDLVAIVLILLSVSGIYIWLRYQRKKR